MYRLGRIAAMEAKLAVSLEDPDPFPVNLRPELNLAEQPLLPSLYNSFKYSYPSSQNLACGE